MKTQDKLNNTFSSERTTEITYWIIGIAIVVFLLLGTTLSAKTPPLNEESYIDDIPFDTEKIVDEISVPAIDFEDETYINDVPFCTSEVVEEIENRSALDNEFRLEDEAYINDIPFNTQVVAENADNCIK
jgi:hypothetical protein